MPPLPEIAVVGRSNVGKSSLLNALAGRKALARTSATPGKTRTLNVYAVGTAYYLVDLPGYGYARASRAERETFRRRVEHYLTTRRRLAGVVWLLDARRAPSADDRRIAELMTRHDLPVLVAVTKADKLSRSQWPIRLRAIAADVGLPEDQCVLTSVRTGTGIETLRASIEALVGKAGA